MSAFVYIGVDDTDIIGSPGTGKIARGLAQHLVDLGLAVSLGVSRHQLLVDSRVKYTSHNSSKGLQLRTDKRPTELYGPSMSYLESHYQPGSDPGLCICAENQITEDVLAFGQRAVTTLLTREEALELASRNRIFLKELGGSGDGIIGALAAVGLRASGNDGRLVDLRGVRDIRGVLSVAELKRRTDIEAVQDTQGKTLADAELIDSLDWIRPSLVGGRVVLKVRAAETSGNRIWIPAEKRLKQEHKEDKGHE